MQMRDVLGTIYDDALFAPLFAVRGRPAETPWRLALVTVMQFVEGLSDRQAAEAVRARIDGKDTLGLELTDAGFDFSVLSAFRARFVEGAAEHLLLDALLTRCTQRGYLRAREQFLPPPLEGPRQRRDEAERIRREDFLVARIDRPGDLDAFDRRERATVLHSSSILCYERDQP